MKQASTTNGCTYKVPFVASGTCLKTRRRAVTGAVGRRQARRNRLGAGKTGSKRAHDFAF